MAYRPAPPELTILILEPAPPPALCTFQGKPAVCARDALNVIPLYQAALRMCNDDRARIALLGKTDGTE